MASGADAGRTCVRTDRSGGVGALGGQLLTLGGLLRVRGLAAGPLTRRVAALGWFRGVHGLVGFAHGTASSVVGWSSLCPAGRVVNRDGGR